MQTDFHDLIRNAIKSAEPGNEAQAVIGVLIGNAAQSIAPDRGAQDSDVGLMARHTDAADRSEPRPDHPYGEQILRTSEVLQKLGIRNRSTLWRWTRDRLLKFPDPIWIGPGIKGWRASDIEAYIDRRAAAGRQDRPSPER